MKTYAEHLKSVQSFGEELPTNYKPTMRSSAVFPLIVRDGKLDSIYTFMGYWLRKRQISVITALLTVRDKAGVKLAVRSHEVRSAKSFVFRGSDLLDGIMEGDSFDGSVEIEIFSAVDMVFPYPAITFALEGVRGLTFVHTCGRVYNDFDDLNQNDADAVPEAGFDVMLEDRCAPFFAFVNGPIAITNQTFELEILDVAGNTKTFERTITSVPKYGLGWINIFETADERKGFVGHKVTVKINHKFKGFFPRFIAGNVLDDFEDVSLTHSYYDTSVDTRAAAIYHNPDPEAFHDSVVAIPVDQSFEEVELAIYPNFATCPSDLTFSLFDNAGNMLAQSDKMVNVANGDNKVTYVLLMGLFDIDASQFRGGMCKVTVKGGGRVPARMKFGLNFVAPKADVNLPSNICFAAMVPNAKIVAKPGTFRWCPLFNDGYQSIYLHNASFVKNGCQTADIKAEICRVSDDHVLSLDLSIPCDGSLEVVGANSDQIKAFLGDEMGWITFQCTSPFVSGYYVTDKGNGVVGADHLY